MRLIFFVIFFLFLRVGYGHDDNTKLKDLTIEVWSTDQGLPSNNLIRIDQDKQGFIWITSYNGLIRFDGNGFDIYNTESLPELKSNGFSSIGTSRDNRMYFGTLTSGLLTYDGREFSLEKIKNDFETSIFPNHPKIEELKAQMYNNGAKFASMTGSGSAVFGIF